VAAGEREVQPPPAGLTAGVGLLLLVTALVVGVGVPPPVGGGVVRVVDGAGLVGVPGELEPPGELPGELGGGECEDALDVQCVADRDWFLAFFAWVAEALAEFSVGGTPPVFVEPLAPGHLLGPVPGDVEAPLSREPGPRPLSLAPTVSPWPGAPPLFPDTLAPVLVLLADVGMIVWCSLGTASTMTATMTSAPAAATTGRSQACGELPLAVSLRRAAHSRLNTVDSPLAMRMSSLPGTRIALTRARGR
jgi:hypothetical protein